MATPATAIVRTTTLNTSHQNYIHGRKRTTRTSLPDDDDDNDDVEESFYIGKDNGFSISSKVAYSDFSVSYSDYDDDDDGNDDGDDGVDEIPAPSKVEATVVERNGIAHDASAPSPWWGTSIWNDNCNIVLKQEVVISNQSTTGVSSLNGINHDIMVPTPSPPSVPEAAADTTPQQSRTAPRILTRSSSSRHDYVSRSLKWTVSQQEDELSRMMPSIDALSSTPERIARLCHVDFMGEDDDDDDDYEDGLVDDDSNSISTASTRANHGLASQAKQTLLSSSNETRKHMLASATMKCRNKCSTSRLGFNLPHTSQGGAAATEPLQVVNTQLVRGKAGLVSKTRAPPANDIAVKSINKDTQSKSKFEPPTAPKRPSSYHIRPESRLYKPTLMRERVQTFGETAHQYLNHGPRDSLPRPRVNKDAQLRAHKPPSFLMSLSRQPSIKSTADFEREKLEHIKPFRPQKIRGSSKVVTSRYKTIPTPPLPSSKALAPSSSFESKSKFEPPTAPKRPSSYHIRPESRLYKPTLMRERVQTFGETAHQYLNHGPRDSLPRPRVNMDAQPRAHKPPSFLSRMSLSRQPSIKSTADFEREKLEHIKPFRAQKIRGSSKVITSRYKTIPTPPLPLSKALAPSSSFESKAKFEPPTAPKPPSSYHIRPESRLYKPTLMRERVQTFGEAAHQYLNHGLRDSLPRPPQKN
jgi:hypothetical protein